MVCLVGFILQHFDVCLLDVVWLRDQEPGVHGLKCVRFWTLLVLRFDELVN
jgi:hypothetical protein